MTLQGPQGTAGPPGREGCRVSPALLPRTRHLSAPRGISPKSTEGGSARHSRGTKSSQGHVLAGAQISQRKKPMWRSLLITHAQAEREEGGKGEAGVWESGG